MSPLELHDRVVERIDVICGKEALNPVLAHDVVHQNLQELDVGPRLLESKHEDKLDLMSHVVI